jgi:hypothetical protein
VTKPLQRRRPNFGAALHPRTEQRIIFDLLWDDPDFRLASDLTTQWALKKRLQRGRKFLLLVTIFRNECSTRRPGGVGESTGSGQP